MTEHSHIAPKKGFNFRRNRLALAAAGLLAVGGAAGAVTVAATRPSVTMAPATPVAIRSLQSDGIVTIRGTVAEIYGNKFVMADPTGRALVDLGREGVKPTVGASAYRPVHRRHEYDGEGTADEEHGGLADLLHCGPLGALLRQLFQGTTRWQAGRAPRT